MSFCSFFGGEVFQNHFEPGVYVCAKCGYELFSSRSKYAHSSPWPAFTETIYADSVTKRPEKNRPEALKVGVIVLVSCGKCGNGLGHEFLNDGPKRGQRRNSCSPGAQGEQLSFQTGMPTVKQPQFSVGTLDIQTGRLGGGYAADGITLGLPWPPTPTLVTE
ncbi:hypothetical protein U0070_005939 [Myodes glareolus]|uniref:Methionine-R-sulfoxide reductase B1 n=1 Tax=Myodes glareolus TaxID=447135 RepID=A0AAW0HIP4_MYOGA